MPLILHHFESHVKGTLTRPYGSISLLLLPLSR